MLESLFGTTVASSGGDPWAKRPAEQHASITLHQQTIAYRVVRSARRRTLTLMVDEQGLRAMAPAQMANARILDFLHEKADWVIARLAEQQKKARANEAPLQLWVMGQSFEMCAHPSLVDSRRGLDVLARTFNFVEGEDGYELARVALQKLAEKEIAKRLPPWSARMGLPLPRWKMSRAESRWGSCSRQRGLSFSWKLGAVFPMLIDYVIVHELAHLRHMNHSQRFWNEVAKYYPSWALARKQLRQFEECLERW